MRFWVPWECDLIRLHISGVFKNQPHRHDMQDGMKKPFLILRFVEEMELEVAENTNAVICAGFRNRKPYD